MPKNYYIILGISSSSSQDEIKSAYRRLAKEFHPDHYGQSSPFLNIQEAYSVLSDPIRRKSYDTTLLENRQPQGRSDQIEPLKESPYLGEVEPLIPERGPVDTGSNSLLQSFYTYRPSLDSLFDRWFSNFSEKSPSKGERLENLTVVITLTPDQAFRGGHVRLTVPTRLQCPSCNGRGGIGAYECWRCSGQGMLSGEFPLMISYPPGISDNHTVQLSLERFGIRNLYLTATFRISEMG
jgi:DnaJ-class molecular chaperone